MTAKIIPLPIARVHRQHTHYRPQPLDPARMARFTPREPLTRRIARLIPWWASELAKAALGLFCVYVWWVILPGLAGL
mgnify:CR=1 FL=1